ncbi:TetR/AcrR family transcriptional regulator [Streptomyces polyrhachis]|uniref:TetR/AcrR family transcriptional regulator n=1 Tax=Streptomyces polyrhachis TaxID=1282885 RepID=A0ABW2GKQ1_9ACTN
MGRAGLSPEAVVDLALALIDEEGPAALTLSAVASRAGVATPSLYKHVRGLADLRDLITRRVLTDLTDRVTAAVLGRSRDEALSALMHAYRAYVRQHPARYSAMSQQPPDHGPTQAAAQRLLDVILATLRGYGLQGPDAVHAARALRSTVHGFAALEAAGGFGLPEDLDTSYDLLTRMTITALSAGATTPG